jgi:Fe(3+) dicitrate transport protein
VAEREALGIVDKPNVIDFGENRNLLDGNFSNLGNETRLLHRYNLGGRQQAFVTGFRLYHGTTKSKSGYASDGSGPDFHFLNPEDVEFFNYTYPNKNYSYFIENIFDITPKLSVTPGLRFEYIKTQSEGYEKIRTLDQAGNVVAEVKVPGDRESKRSFLIGGIGISYKATEKLEVYSNVTQNYRAINFSDLKIVKGSFASNLDLKDENGYSIDLGMRGDVSDFLSFEVTAFYISYKDKIGNVLKTDPKTNIDYLVRENVSDARIYGIESFAELSVNKLIGLESNSVFSLFVNSSVINGRYINSEVSSFENNKVEMVPPLMIRSGLGYRYKNFSSALQFSYTTEHFSDATNATWNSTGIEGIIPTYKVMDISAAYTWKILKLEASCNNLLNEQYFTRRAEAYPGPGIIPADGRGVYVTLQAKIGK